MILEIHKASLESTPTLQIVDTRVMVPRALVSRAFGAQSFGVQSFGVQSIGVQSFLVSRVLVVKSSLFTLLEISVWGRALG